MLFPRFYNLNIIDSIRKKYDPLANCIAPHITIVFPFDSDIATDDLKQHLNKVLRGIKKFKVQLKAYTGDFRDGYLFLNVKKGNDKIIELHDKIYSGILESFLLRKVTYCPHLTVGRLQQSEEFDKALYELCDHEESFETIVDKIDIVNIEIIEEPLIEFSLEFE